MVPARIWTVRYRAAVRMSLRIDQPVRSFSERALGRCGEYDVGRLDAHGPAPSALCSSSRLGPRAARRGGPISLDCVVQVQHAVARTTWSGSSRRTVPT